MPAVNKPAMDALKVLLESSKKSGLDVEIKRQGPNGELRPTAQGEIDALHTKARVASTAQLLERLSAAEKLQWAIDTKNEGNALFAARSFAAAAEKYVEALTAADFGASAAENEKSDSSAGNVNELVLPVLCNLCSCCLELQQWRKCVLFAEQALRLSAHCEKALYRKAVALVRMGEYDQGIRELKELIEPNPQRTGAAVLLLSDSERDRARHWLRRTHEMRRAEKEQIERQRANLRKAFHCDPQVQAQSTIVAEKKEEELQPMTLGELLVFLVQYAFRLVLRFFSKPAHKKS